MNPTNQTNHDALRRMLQPQSIALVGASADKPRIGGRALDSMRLNGYQGRLYPVNPKGDQIQGIPAYPGLRDIGEPLDLVICSLPASQVLDVARECAALGVAGLVVYAAGFAEIGEAGAAIQDELQAVARASDMRILGPNSLGFVNYRHKVIATFHSVFSSPLPPAGRVSVVSQSGAFLGLVAMMGHERQLGFSHLIATGNEGELQAADCIEYLADDPHTDVILCYLETCRDGKRLELALARARDRNKKVVAVKLGRTEAGARAAQSHTAALAGNDAVYDALFRQYGVYRADSIEEYFDVGVGASLSPPLANERVCVVSISGGVGVLLADHAAAGGLQVSELPEAARQRIKTLIPLADSLNPIDVTGMAVDKPEVFGQALEAVLETGHYASVVVYYGGYLVTQAQVQAQLPLWIDFRQRYPHMVFAVTGFLASDAVRQFQEIGVLAYREPTDAIRTLSALNRFAANARRPAPEAAPSITLAPTPVAPVGEAAALAWLDAAGIPVVRHHMAHSADEAAHAAGALGYPVALKVVADGVLHKSDVGGVRLNLRDESEVRQAFDAIVEAVRRARPAAPVRGCLVVPMAADGVEVVLGMVRDPVFGPVVMFGLGGVFVEVLKDVAFRIAPFGVDEAQRMIGEIRGYAILQGVRGRPACDLPALARTLSRFSALAAKVEPAVQSFEINPLRVLSRGQGVLALDAVVEVMPINADNSAG